MTPIDTLLIILIATVGVGGAKLIYAWLADRASLVFKNPRLIQGLNGFAAGVMILVGLVLLLKTREWV